MQLLIEAPMFSFLKRPITGAPSRDTSRNSDASSASASRLSPAPVRAQRAARPSSTTSSPASRSSGNWNRIGHFQEQDVTLRLIAERLLPADHPPTYVQGELVSQTIALPRPRDGRRFHAFASPSNVGAAALLKEVNARLRLGVEVTEERLQLEECECMLVLLTKATWTSNEATARLVEDVQRAIGLGVRLLLAHEMMGSSEQAARGACEFGEFFSTTPPLLLRAGIYDKIAVALKGGAWREASMYMLAQAIAEAPAASKAHTLRHEIASIMTHTDETVRRLSTALVPARLSAAARPADSKQMATRKAAASRATEAGGDGEARRAWWAQAHSLPRRAREWAVALLPHRAVTTPILREYASRSAAAGANVGEASTSQPDGGGRPKEAYTQEASLASEGDERSRQSARRTSRVGMTTDWV